jgi:hypothetical protein
VVVLVVELLKRDRQLSFQAFVSSKCFERGHIQYRLVTVYLLLVVRLLLWNCQTWYVRMLWWFSIEIQIQLQIFVMHLLFIIRLTFCVHFVWNLSILYTVFFTVPSMCQNMWPYMIGW